MSQSKHDESKTDPHFQELCWKLNAYIAQLRKLHAEAESAQAKDKRALYQQIIKTIYTIQQYSH